MTTSNFQQLFDCGQSLWIDFLSRQMLESGELEDRVQNDVLRGMTSNPSIFEKSMTSDETYRPGIEHGIRQEMAAQEIYEKLAFEDIRRACDTLRLVYDASDGLDGYVSMEVSPHLARDIAGTMSEARRFFNEIDRDNVMIKIPGTLEGLAAIEQAISEGINVNVTLLFSIETYKQAAFAYIRGLEKRLGRGEPIDRVASVASFFLSRIDTKVDHYIDSRKHELGRDDVDTSEKLDALKGEVAIANAKIAYQEFQSIFSGDRWQRLADAGASVQRLLWASTSTKNPAYSDVRYVDELVGADTVNTMPVETIDAFGDHGTVNCNAVTTDVEAAHSVINRLSDKDVQINLESVMDELLEEAIQKFVQPYDSLLESLESRVKELTPA
ncbi:MAG: transaldolase [Elainellaceae cyanobacterium]